MSTDFVGKFQEFAREILADVRMRMAETERAEARGWVYVVRDQETDRLIFVAGVFDSPEAALLASEKERKSDDGLLNDNEPGWDYIILPLHTP